MTPESGPNTDPGLQRDPSPTVTNSDTDAPYDVTARSLDTSKMTLRPLVSRVRPAHIRNFCQQLRCEKFHKRIQG